MTNDELAALDRAATQGVWFADRAKLEAEWEAPVSDGRRTGPEAF